MTTLASALDSVEVPLAYGPLSFRRWQFIGDPHDETQPGPNSNMLEATPDFVGKPHYHFKDEYQVFIHSTGSFTNRPVTPPVTVAYNDAYSVYGPFNASEGVLRWITLREVPDPEGAQWITDPAAVERRKGHVAKQFIVRVTPEPASPGELELLHDRGDGTCLYRMALEAGASLDGPALGLSRGHWYMVIGGSIEHDGRLHPSPSQLHVENGEQPPTIQAGPEGADVLVFGFRTQPED